MPVIRVKAKPKRPNNTMIVNMAGEAQLEAEGNHLKGFEFSWDAILEWDNPWEQSVTIPDSVDAVVPYAFQKSKALRHLDLRGTALTLGEGAFSSCGALKTVVLPFGTKAVSEEAFSGCRALEAVQLPDSVEKIGTRTFLDCTSLQTVHMPASLKEIGTEAFRNCSSLEEVILPEGVTRIGAYAFSGCTRLKRVVLPASLETICTGAFQNCTSLEEIEIPSGVAQLPELVFSGCRNLRRVVLHKDIIFVSNYAFIQCENLSPCFMHTGHELISGDFLSALGYPGFHSRKSYRLTQTRYAGLLEVTSNYYEGGKTDRFVNDWMLMTLDLKPVPQVPSFYGLTDKEMQEKKFLFRSLMSQAADILSAEWMV